tara:strand:- start:187 stop:1203 length:1017 start_codon:yes stop_codon:yes gene_type:complete
MKTNKLKDIFQSDFLVNESVSDNWHTLESDALELGFLDNALDLVSDKDVARLEERINSKIALKSDLFLNYYLSIMLLIVLGLLSYLVFSFQDRKLVEHKQVSLASNAIYSHQIIAKKSSYSSSVKSSEMSGVVNVSKEFRDINAKSYPEMHLCMLSEVPIIEKPTQITKLKRHFDYRYLRNFKVLNFQAKKTKDEFRFLSGTPVYTGTVELDRDQEQKIELHYYRKLDRALYLMSKGKYERSLTLFAAFKYLFPKDQNILFYSGLVHFKNEDYGYAMHRWERLLHIECGFFQEEASWYQALALCNLNQFDKAKSVLANVVEEDGFYKKQATLKLSEIE